MTPPINANLFSVHLKYSESCGKRRRGGSAKAVEMSFHSSIDLCQWHEGFDGP